MNIIKIKIEPLLLVLSIIIQIEVNSFEIKSVMLVLILAFFFILNKGRVFKNDFELLSLLILIILIGVVSAIFNSPVAYDFLKDLLYFSKPIILILLGYFIAKRINNWKVLFKTLIYLGVTYAGYHILHVLFFTDLTNTTVSQIRGINGLSNIIEAFAIAFITLSYKYPSFNVISKNSTKRLFLILLITSFILYFSRTMLVGLVILILGVLNYIKLNRKGLKYGFIIFLTIGSLYTYLYNTNIDRKGDAIESFLYKLKIAPEEIFSPKLDIKNKASLWDHWRAYEAYSAFVGLNESPYSYPFGKGFGALIDLKFVAPLGGEKGMRYIPILHNGYVFILYKTGIIGFLLYVTFLFYLYFQSYIRTKCIENQVFRNILAALGLYIIFSSLIITGLYNLEEVTPLILGVFIFLTTNSKIADENRDCRN